MLKLRTEGIGLGQEYRVRRIFNTLAGAECEEWSLRSLVNFIRKLDQPSNLKTFKDFLLLAEWGPSFLAWHSRSSLTCPKPPIILKCCSWFLFLFFWQKLPFCLAPSYVHPVSRCCRFSLFPPHFYSRSSLHQTLCPALCLSNPVLPWQFLSILPLHEASLIPLQSKQLLPPLSCWDICVHLSFGALPHTALCHLFGRS